MAWADKELELSDNQLLNSGNQVWSTNTIGSNSLRDLGRGKPLWANLHIAQKEPTTANALLRVSLRLHTSPTPPAVGAAFAYTQLGLPIAKSLDTLVVGSRLCFPIHPVVPNLDPAALSASLNDWNHPALGKRFITALYERTSLLDENSPTGAFNNLIVSLELSLQPTAGFAATDQQYYPSGFRA